MLDLKTMFMWCGLRSISGTSFKAPITTDCYGWLTNYDDIVIYTGKTDELINNLNGILYYIKEDEYVPYLESFDKVYSKMKDILYCCEIGYVRYDKETVHGCSFNKGNVIVYCGEYPNDYEISLSVDDFLKAEFFIYKLDGVL